MAESIIECDTFQEYYKKKIYIDDDTYYTHENFENFDVEISSIGKMFSEIGKCEWRALETLKENKKRISNGMLLLNDIYKEK